MATITAISQSHQQTDEPHYGLTRDQKIAFDTFKERCASAALLGKTPSRGEDDVMEGIYDDGTLLLVSLYDSIDIKDYEETRKLYTHWTGRRDKHGIPVFLFDIGKLTSDVMSTYKKSCASAPVLTEQLPKGNTVESIEMLRLFCTYDSLVTFVLPLCSAVPGRPELELPVTQTNCIVDISGTDLLQFWKLRDHMQSASTLATSHYPETLGRTYIIGAPYFFHVVGGWLKKWFDPITVSKIFIVPHGEELSTLSSAIDPINIPRRYGGQLDYDFGTMPNLDPEIKKILKWSTTTSGKLHESLTIGPMKWFISEEGKRVTVATGSVDGKQRSEGIATLVI